MSTALFAERPVVSGTPVLELEGLTVSVRGTGIEIVRAASLAIASGEIVGLVGESGSGKSTLALATLWHAARGLVIARGTARLRGRELRGLDGGALRRMRGRDVAYVAQDPARALNPARRIGDQLREMLREHGAGGSADQLAAAMADVDLPGDQAFLRRFPHQLSGGQQQRVALAIAFVCRPALVALDEPTTGLDVRTQAHVLRTVRDLCARTGASALYVSHDLAVVGGIADRLAVMYAGRIVELGPTEAVIRRPAHPYTRRLLAAVPEGKPGVRLMGIPGRAPPPDERLPGCAFLPRCGMGQPRCAEAEPEARVVTRGHSARCWRASESEHLVAPQIVSAAASGDPGAALVATHLNAFYNGRQALHGVSLVVPRGRCVALVGESGSGKTTTARCLAGMHRHFTGAVSLEGQRLASAARRRPAEVRRAIQYVFQNPYSALNPRATIGQALRQWLDVLDRGGAEPSQRVGEALDQVGLGVDVVGRYPDELSGGQQQRVAIARALICKPSFLICDEITSALDVSVQASIMTLLETLRERRRLGILFVTHNLLLVRSIADIVVVMRHGRVVEAGPTEVVFTTPAADYTRDLLRLTPSLHAPLDAGVSA